MYTIVLFFVTMWPQVIILEMCFKTSGFILETKWRLIVVNTGIPFVKTVEQINHVTTTPSNNNMLFYAFGIHSEVYESIRIPNCQAYSVININCYWYVFPCNYRPRPCKRSLADAVKQTHHGGICPKKDQVCCPGTVWYEYVGKCLGKCEPKVLILIIPFNTGQHEMVYHT